MEGGLTLTGQRTSQSGTAAEAMLSIPWTHPPAVTVGELADFFRDDHVHAALIVDPAGHLAAVVERGDITECAPDALAAEFGRLDARTVLAGASLGEARLGMIAAKRRRAAVVSADGRLLGLLCLKASRAGFCSDQDVLDRSREPGQRPVSRSRRDPASARPAP